MRVSSKTASKMTWFCLHLFLIDESEFRLMSAPGSSLPLSAYVPIESSRMLKQECFPYETKKLLPKQWFCGGALVLILNVVSWPDYPASLCSQQYPRALWRPSQPLWLAGPSHPFVMSTCTFWPTDPQFHPWVLPVLSGGCHLLLVIYLHLVCQLSRKSLVHLLPFEFVCMPCWSPEQPGSGIP